MYGDSYDLVDPFGHHGWALPAGWGATEGASRRHDGPRVTWHVDYSTELAKRWEGAVDLVFFVPEVILLALATRRDRRPGPNRPAHAVAGS